MLNRLDEIVFEGRNKEYGAYRLRKGYGRLLARANIISSLLFVLFWLGIQAYYYLHEDRSPYPEMVVMYEDMVSMYGDELAVPPPPDQADIKRADQNLVPVPGKTAVLEVTNANDSVREIEKRDDKPDHSDSTSNAYGTAGSSMGSDTGAVYIRVERLPEFPGGRTALDKYLRDNIKYPSVLRDKKTAGVVHVSFVITSGGRVEQVKVTQSLHPLIDAEAVRVIRAMPLWSPGRRHGQAVNVLLKLPLRFLPGQGG